MTGRILVTGATGAVGPSVVRVLLETGYTVRVLRRPGDRGAVNPAVELVTGDITDSAAVERACNGVEGIVHLAALLHETDRASAEHEYQRVNTQGTATLLAAALRAGARRTVVLSTIAVYGEQRGGGVATESTAPKPETAYARSKLDAERLALRAIDNSGRPVAVVLRAAAVYGPRVKGNYRRLVVSLSRRRFVPVGEGRNRRTLVFDDDLALAVRLALEHPGAAGRVFNVTDGRFHPVNEIMRAICSALGRRPPRVRVPFPVAKAACRAVESVATVLGREPLLRAAALEKYVEDVAVSGELIRKELGFNPRYDLASGWEATIAGLSAEGAI